MISVSLLNLLFGPCNVFLTLLNCLSVFVLWFTECVLYYLLGKFQFSMTLGSVLGCYYDLRWWQRLWFFLIFGVLCSHFVFDVSVTSCNLDQLRSGERCFLLVQRVFCGGGNLCGCTSLVLLAPSCGRILRLCVWSSSFSVSGQLINCLFFFFL